MIPRWPHSPINVMLWGFTSKTCLELSITNWITNQQLLVMYPYGLNTKFASRIMLLIFIMTNVKRGTVYLKGHCWAFCTPLVVVQIRLQHDVCMQN